LPLTVQVVVVQHVLVVVQQLFVVVHGGGDVEFTVTVVVLEKMVVPAEVADAWLAIVAPETLLFTDALMKTSTRVFGGTFPSGQEIVLEPIGEQLLEEYGGPR
jgi:hypothetical protein